MRSLRFKIAALAALLVVVTQAGTVGTLLLAADREVGRTAARKLVSTGTMFSRVLALRAEQMRNSMRIVAAEPEFLAAVAAGDGARIGALLDRSGTRMDADVYALLGADGQVLGGSAEAGPVTGQLAAALYAAFGSGTSHGIVRHGNAAYEVAAVPVTQRAGGQPAWLAIGIRIDDERARRFAVISGVDVAFIATTGATPALLGTSVAGIDVGRLAVAGGAPVRDASGIFDFSAGQGAFLAMRQPLLADKTGVELLLLESLEEAMAPFQLLRSATIVLAALALSTALAGASLVARAIARPVRELAQAAERIRNGDYGVPVASAADHELGTLAVAFNTMQSGIAERERRITYQAQYDPVTGLPNRLLARARLDQAIARPQARATGVAVLVVALGGFEDTSASLGHDIGEALLAQAAERLRASVEAGQTLARLEGDRFAIILGQADAALARVRAEDLLRLLGLGLAVHDVNISLDAVIGIALYPDHGTDADQLLLRAMVAQNDARTAGQRLSFYQHGREEHRARQLALLGDLPRAVRRDELRLYMQPKLSLREGRICGAEALVRWDHPTFGWLPPGEFIGIAEQFGNISLVTRWALTAAVRECRLWVEDGLDLSVSVNISSRDLIDQDLPVFVPGLLRDHDLAPRHLTLELTEEALVQDPARATLVLQRLRDLGVRIAIDDFGTGYSSLAQIRNLPVDEVKIDRTFVMRLPQDRDDVAIVRAAIDLAHDLGLETVAEGVETGAALRWLAASGCECAQGFLISRPVPAEALVGWVRGYGDDAQATGIVLPGQASAAGGPA